jgi:hypothetical protein
VPWQRVKCLLPSARGNAVFRSIKIRLGDLQIEHWLTQCLIFGVNDLAGFIFIILAEAGAFARLGIHAINGSIADTATD